MNIKTKHLFLELAWLGFCLLLSIFIVLFFWEWNLRYRIITIEILGTDVAFSDTGLVICIGSLMTFFVFITKEFLSGRNNVLGKLVGFIAGLIFIVSLSHLRAGWTSYPPLQALGDKEFTWEEFRKMVLFLRVSVIILMLVGLFFWIRKNSLRLR